MGRTWKNITLKRCCFIESSIWRRRSFCVFTISVDVPCRASPVDFVGQSRQYTVDTHTARNSRFMGVAANSPASPQSNAAMVKNIINRGVKCFISKRI